MPFRPLIHLCLALCLFTTPILADQDHDGSLQTSPVVYGMAYGLLGGVLAGAGYAMAKMEAFSKNRQFIEGETEKLLSALTIDKLENSGNFSDLLDHLYGGDAAQNAKNKFVMAMIADTANECILKTYKGCWGKSATRKKTYNSRGYAKSLTFELETMAGFLGDLKRWDEVLDGSLLITDSRIDMMMDGKEVTKRLDIDIRDFGHKETQAQAVKIAQGGLPKHLAKIRNRLRWGGMGLGGAFGWIVGLF